MQLSLARWEDDHGDSAGYWLIREIPGFFLERSLEGKWELKLIRLPVEYPLASTVMQAPCDTWGADWESDSQLYDQLPDQVKVAHASRAQVLMKLEAHLGQHQDLALSEALGV